MTTIVRSTNVSSVEGGGADWIGEWVCLFGPAVAVLYIIPGILHGQSS